MRLRGPGSIDGTHQYRLVAVEASSYLYGIIPQHLAQKEVDPAASHIFLVKGAVAAASHIVRPDPRVRRVAYTTPGAERMS
jgi:hypothetical protein